MKTETFFLRNLFPSWNNYHGCFTNMKRVPLTIKNFHDTIIMNGSYGWDLRFSHYRENFSRNEEKVLKDHGLFWDTFCVYLEIRGIIWDFVWRTEITSLVDSTRAHFLDHVVFHVFSWDSVWPIASRIRSLSRCLRRVCCWRRCWLGRCCCHRRRWQRWRSLRSTTSTEEIFEVGAGIWKGIVQLSTTTWFLGLQIKFVFSYLGSIRSCGIGAEIIELLKSAGLFEDFLCKKVKPRVQRSNTCWNHVFTISLVMKPRV